MSPSPSPGTVQDTVSVAGASTGRFKKDKEKRQRGEERTKEDACRQEVENSPGIPERRERKKEHTGWKQEEGSETANSWERF